MSWNAQNIWHDVRSCGCNMCHDDRSDWKRLGFIRKNDLIHKVRAWGACQFARKQSFLTQLALKWEKSYSEF